jgi:hypothetical protein
LNNFFSKSIPLLLLSYILFSSFQDDFAFDNAAGGLIATYAILLWSV